MFENSVLLLKANKESIEEVYKEPFDEQISVFRETLEDLEEYLDTGDLARIKLKPLQVIKTDLLWIIKGFREIQSSSQPEFFTYVESVDKILESLRSAKIIVFEVEGMFTGGELKDDKREAFFNKIEDFRKHILKSLTAFREVG